MSTRTTKSTGDRGEQIAADWLEARGFVVMDRNYRFERGELDLVAFDTNARAGAGEIVFVEVKARRGTGFGRPEEAVGEDKQKRLWKVAEAYMHERRLTGSPARFDVVAVVMPEGREPEVEHFANAFGMW
jgi:putative endonuclease